MTAIIVGPAPIDGTRVKGGKISPVDYMPFNTRHKVAGELNRLWKEFVEEMHDGDTGGPDVADKFWRYVLAGG